MLAKKHLALWGLCLHEKINAQTELICHATGHLDVCLGNSLKKKTKALHQPTVETVGYENWRISHTSAWTALI